MRVLIASPNSDFAGAARSALRNDSLTVDVVEEMESAIEQAGSVPYDVIILDFILPKSHGAEAIRKLRKRRVSAALLAVLGETKPQARVEALRFGADDCLVFPVDYPELVARVHALARRAGRKAGNVLEVEDLVLHCDKRVAFRSGRSLSLTAREFAALEYLVRAHGRMVPTAELFGSVWHGQDAPRNNFVAVVIMRLRKKVDAGQAVPLIYTVRGGGYVVSADGP